MRGLGAVGVLDGSWEVVGHGPHPHYDLGPLALAKDPGLGARRWPSPAVVGVESLEGAMCLQTLHLMSSLLQHGAAGGAQAVEQAL